MASRSVIVHSGNQAVLVLGDCITVGDVKGEIANMGIGIDPEQHLLVAKTGSAEHPEFTLLDDDEELLEEPDLHGDNLNLNVALHECIRINPPTKLSLTIVIKTDEFRPEMERNTIIDSLYSNNNVLQLKEIIDELYGVPPSRQFLHVLDIPFPGEGQLVQFPVFGHQLNLGSMLMSAAETHRIGVTCWERPLGSTAPVNVVVQLLTDNSPRAPVTLELDLQSDTLSTLTVEIESRDFGFGTEGEFEIRNSHGEDITAGWDGTTTLGDCGINPDETIYVYEV